MILFRCDASPEIGLGHLMRCLGLAQRFAAEGAQVRFVTRRDAGAERMLSRAGYATQWVAANASLSEVCDAIRQAASEAAQWCVIDAYEERQAQCAAAAEAGARVALIDDEGGDVSHAELLINPNLGAAPSWYPSSNGTRLLLGGAYAWVRDAFLAIRERGLKPIGAAHRVLVTLGGSDRLHRTLTILSGLERLSSAVRAAVEIDVVLGPGYRDPDTVRQRAERFSGRCRVHESVEDMAELMAQADLAISASGTTLYELACLGVPSLSVIVAKNQEPNAAAFAEQGMTRSLGLADRLDPPAIAAAVEGLIADEAARRHLRECALRAIDGRGAERIWRALNEVRVA